MRRLLSPRWLAAHLFVLAVCVTCLVLGFWQLDRLQEERLDNAVQEARLQAEPLPLEDLLRGAGEDLDSLEYRMTSVSGTFRPSDEVLIRSQVLSGQAGFDIVTPLVTDDGSIVAVNRGWVPLEYDTTPVTATPPPEGTVTVEGLVRQSERGAGGVAVAGDRTLTRVDISAMEGTTGLELLPVYVEVVGEQELTSLPVRAALPDFEDEGPHLSYAIQWFSFALVGAVGYGFLLRREIRRSSGGESETVDDLHSRELA